MNAQSEAMKYFDALTDNVDRLTQLFAEGLNEIGNLTETESKKNTAENGGVKYSFIEPFIDDYGNKYNNAVLLDTDFFDGISPRNWGKHLKTYVEDRSKNNPLILPIVDENGMKQNLYFAGKNERTGKGGKSHKVISELYETSDNISKLSVIHIDEIIEVSEENNPYYSDDNTHGWLDKNGWLHRNANVINIKNGAIYNVTFDIAKSNDGRTILYATSGNIKKVGHADVNSLKIKGSGQESNFSYNISNPDEKVNTENQKTKFNLRDNVEETKDLIAVHNNQANSRSIRKPFACIKIKNTSN